MKGMVGPVATLAVLALLGGCGADGEPLPPPPKAPEQTGIRISGQARAGVSVSRGAGGALMPVAIARPGLGR